MSLFCIPPRTALIARLAMLACLVALLFAAGQPASASWWSEETLEESYNVAEGIDYERRLYRNQEGQPVRAHIVSVTGVGDSYIFGVLGSFGALIEPSVYARNTEALLVINGGFFSWNPTRAIGLVMAHGRVLYPPPTRRPYHATLGFTPDQVLFDWVGPDEVAGNTIQKDNPAWQECHAALGAGPLLIRKRHSRVEGEIEAFNMTQRAPRTAVGQLDSGKILIYVVDGRQPGWSAGVTLGELAELFLARDAADAINLDGGGSSTLVIGDEVINRPSDRALPNQPGVERAVANVVALFAK